MTAICALRKGGYSVFRRASIRFPNAIIGG
jgi:hypothetical protein